MNGSVPWSPRWLADASGLDLNSSFAREPKGHQMLIPAALISALAFNVVAREPESFSLDCSGIFAGTDQKRSFHLKINETAAVLIEAGQSEVYINETGSVFWKTDFEITFSRALSQDLGSKYVIDRSSGKYMHTYEGSQSVERDIGTCAKGAPKNIEKKI